MIRWTLGRHHLRGPAQPEPTRDEHLDLFLELTRGGPLATWRLPARVVPRTPFEARRLPFHRNVYLRQRGPVIGRGWIELIAFGTARVFRADDDACRLALDVNRAGARSGLVGRWPKSLLLELERQDAVAAPAAVTPTGPPSRPPSDPNPPTTDRWIGIFRPIG